MKKLKIKDIYRKFLSVSKNTCSICRENALGPQSAVDSVIYLCYRCGPIILSGTLDAELNLKKEKNRILSSYLRERFEKSDNIKSLDLNTYNFKEMREIANELVPKPSEKPYKLLYEIENLQDYMGESVPVIDVNEESENLLIQKYLEAMSYSLNKVEYEYILETLKKLGYIETRVDRSIKTATITQKGYEFLEEYRQQKRNKSKNVFIAIKFSEEYKNIAEAIKKAVKETGFNPIKVDEEQHTEYIMDFIKSKIKESKFMIAELTSENLGVYFESGYAMGLGIPIIAILRKSKDNQHFKKVHFDLKQFNIIEYENEKDLEEKLKNRINVLFV